MTDIADADSAFRLKLEVHRREALRLLDQHGSAGAAACACTSMLAWIVKASSNDLEHEQAIRDRAVTLLDELLKIMTTQRRNLA